MRQATQIESESYQVVAKKLDKIKWKEAPKHSGDANFRNVTSNT